MRPRQVEYFVGLKAALESAPQGKRGRLVRRAARLLGTSESSIYRRLEAVGFDSGRKRRVDEGTTCVDRDLALTASGLIREATRANGKKTLSINTVTGILEENGLGPLLNENTGEVSMPSPGTVARAMRLHGCHPDQIGQGAPHVQQRSLHPNHVWQMDASVCVLFYLPNGKAKVLDERLYNPKKPGNLAKLNKERVVRWVITDHYSGAIFAWYSLGAEDAATAIETLIRAMCKRADGDLLHGAPRILYTDPGGAYDCELMRGFLKRIGVRYIPHAAGNARATGSVEAAQNIVETQFEGRLRMYDIGSLDQLNECLTSWRLMFNTHAVHSRYSKSRNSLWLTIAEEQLRVPASEEALRALVASHPESRKVKGNLLISFAPKGYKALCYSLRNIPGVSVGSYVYVSVNPFEAPAVDVAVKLPGEDERVYTIAPVQKDKAGFALNAPVIGEEYKALPDTRTDKVLKDMDKAAFAAPTLAAAQQARKAKKKPWQEINIMADIEAARKPVYLPRRGRRLELDVRGRELAPISAVEAALRLRPGLAAQGVAWGPEHLDVLKARYPGGVPVEALEDIAAGFAAEARKERQAGLRLVAGGEA